MTKGKSKMSEVKVDYRSGVAPDPKQQDAIFFTGFGLLATVSYEGFAVDIYCDGETKAHLLDSPQGQVVRSLYDPSDFIDAGLTTDDALRLANEQGLLDWASNSWFDLYCYGEHLDCVSHEISEAIAYAETYLKDRRASEMIMTGEK